ncbi:MAG: hypothetical protein K9G59_18250 [Caulobacter sp.]|nr:hypothetical protein [Caulobacter sp.]
MTASKSSTARSALTMRILGWGVIAGSVIAVVYPPGFLWGTHPASAPFLFWQHPASHLNGLHPYLYMLFSLYVAWAILMIRGARDPKANAALFDFGILGNLMHAGVMAPQAFLYPNEHAHLWADVPLLVLISGALWLSHPNRHSPADPSPAPDS